LADDSVFLSRLGKEGVGPFQEEKSIKMNQIQIVLYVR
jgi:hypothetical protein